MHLNRAWIAARIPHQGRLCLLDDDNTGAAVPALDHHLLRLRNRGREHLSFQAAERKGFTQGRVGFGSGSHVENHRSGRFLPPFGLPSEGG